VNHKDGDKLNNNVINLEWCDNFHNMNHAKTTGLLNTDGENSPNNVYTELQILEVKRLLKEGEGNVRISKITGVSRHTVYKVKMNKTWKHL
jgi:uncharacterized protein YerC